MTRGPAGRGGEGPVRSDPAFTTTSPQARSSTSLNYFNHRTRFYAKDGERRQSVALMHEMELGVFAYMGPFISSLI